MSETGTPTPLDTCGCCDDGVEEPSHVNPPGQPALRYRIGTHPDFLARMTARIHAWEVLTCDQCEERYAGPDRLTKILDHIAKAHPSEPNPADLVVAERPLAGLGTRASDDPAVALMDAWSVVGDVVTFYQERLANEHYLRTAVERRSILELARAIGYLLDPGVAAETYLAFTVDDAEGAPERAEVPAGTQVLSIPASSDERPQTFETDADLTAHAAWNALRPRRQHPHILASDDRYVYFAGTATGLKAGHLVLFFFVDGTHSTRRVTAVHADRDADRTRVELEGGGSPPSTELTVGTPVVLDPNQEPIELSREHVDEHVVHKTWKETDLQAFLTMLDWDAGEVLAYVDDIRAASFGDEDQQIAAFRERLAFFGHNAPFYDSLPADPDSTASPKAKLWPVDWDSDALSIWTDSITEDYYYDEDAGEHFDVYLERAVSELKAGTWTIIERPLNERDVFQVTDVTEASRSGFGMSAKVNGLQLADADGNHLANDTDDKPEEFHFRRSTAYVKSELLAPAPLPIDDHLEAGTDKLFLGTMVLGLQEGQTVALRGEVVDTDGDVRSEMLTIEEVVHSAGYTRLTFENGLERSYVRGTVEINANVVLASHGETVADEVLGSGDGAAVHQRFTLKKPPLTHRSVVGGSESELTVRVDGVEWSQHDTLYRIHGTARAYVVRIDNEANASVTFGDGKSGARLPSGAENVTATYRSGVGSAGEVGAGSLTLLKTRPFGIRGVSNPLAASGADDPEKLEDARSNAPLTVLTLDRIVSLQDYEDYARAYPGIGKARADAVWTGEGEVVHITVADSDGDAVIDPLYSNLLASIEEDRDPLLPVELETFTPFVFFVTASVLIDDAYLWEDVEAALQEGLKQAFSFDERGFGQPVTAAEVLQVMHDVDGVLAVDLDELYKTTPDATPSGSLFNTVLPSNVARFDDAAGDILQAELLLIHPFGINLSQMIV